MTAPAQLYRTSFVAGDPLRSLVYAWCRDGGLSCEYVELRKKGSSYDTAVKMAPLILGTIRDQGDEDWHCGAVVPEGVSSGQYTLTIDQHSWDVAIATAPTDPIPIDSIPAGYSVGAVEKALAKGRIAALAPGDHAWTRALYVPTVNASIIGQCGARVVRIPNGDYLDRCIIPADGLMLNNIVFELSPGSILLHGQPTRNVNLHRLVIRGGNLGWALPGAYIAECRFECGCPIAPAGLWYRNWFRDTPVEDAWKTVGDGPVAMIDADFARTDRGPIFQLPADALVESPLFVGLRCRDIERGNNGNEILMTEGGGTIQNGLFLHTRIKNCDSNVFQWVGGVNVRNCLVRDLSIANAGQIWMGEGNGDVSGNVFERFELTNTAGIVLGVNATDNTFRDGAVVNYRPSRVNQTWYSPSFYAPRPAVADNGAGNTFDGVTISQKSI